MSQENKTGKGRKFNISHQLWDVLFIKQYFFDHDAQFLIKHHFIRRLVTSRRLYKVTDTVLCICLTAGLQSSQMLSLPWATNAFSHSNLSDVARSNFWGQHAAVWTAGTRHEHAFTMQMQKCHMQWKHAFTVQMQKSCTHSKQISPSSESIVKFTWRNENKVRLGPGTDKDPLRVSLMVKYSMATRCSIGRCLPSAVWGTNLNGQWKTRSRNNAPHRNKSCAPNLEYLFSKHQTAF